MIRILILVLAVAAGVSLGFVLARLQAKRQQRTKQTTYVDVEDGKPTPILPWLIGLVVLFVGLLWLANSEPGSIDTQYNPARLENGELIPPHFSNRTENNTEINANATSPPIILPPSTPLSLPTPPPLPLPSRDP